jgi:hypothetical protein
MKCPRCEGDVELIDSTPHDEDATFGRVQCPHPTCARDLVLARLPLEEAALLAPQAARDAAWRAGRSPPSFLVTAFIVCGIAVSALMIAGSALPDVLLLLLAASALAGMVVAPFAVDRALGTRLWLRTLRRRPVTLVARKTGYRA